jgi:hypothetical protein
MDEDLIRKAKEALNARVSSPATNTYNIVVPITERDFDLIINLFLNLLDKREDYGTFAENTENSY